MSVALTRSLALVGMAGRLVEVEVNHAQGLPAMNIVGLADTAVSESRDRVRAATVNSGEKWPAGRVTVGLYPADLHKRGSAFDVAVAVAIQRCLGALPAADESDRVYFGELGLDGRVRPVRGVLPAVLSARAAGMAQVVVPEANVTEAALVPGIEVIGVRSLRHVFALLRGAPDADEVDLDARFVSGGSAIANDSVGEGVHLPEPDLADVVGQIEARRALEIAAAGGHHLLMHGPPGAGKTMLAERLPGLLPPLLPDAALEVTAIHSLVGLLEPGRPLIDRPPFHAPHHTASKAALVGGGSHVATPGLVSLADHGVLFLDEAPEFSGDVLEALREPLESGRVTIARAGFRTTFPARFSLVLAANPCPCARMDCSCTPYARRRYAARLSAPLLDRIDLLVPVDRISTPAMLGENSTGEDSATVRARVLAARALCAARLAGTPWSTNAAVSGRALRTNLAPSARATRGVLRALDAGALTARGVVKVLRVAWTIADLDGVARPDVAEVDAALALRIGQIGVAA